MQLVGGTFSLYSVWRCGTGALPALTQASTQGMGSKGAFKGCHFTLAAADEEEKQLAKNMILQDGGRIFTHTSCQLVRDKALDTHIFAVCPMGLPRSKLVTLEKLEDFRLGEPVPEACLAITCVIPAILRGNVMRERICYKFRCFLLQLPDC